MSIETPDRPVLAGAASECHQTPVLLTRVTGCLHPWLRESDRPGNSGLSA